MQNRLSLQQINFNYESVLSNQAKTAPHSRSGQENIRLPVIAPNERPSKLMQSLQGLTKYFNKDKEHLNQFKSVHQQVKEMRQLSNQKSSNSLSPKYQKPVRSEQSAQTGQLFSSFKVDCQHSEQQAPDSSEKKPARKSQEQPAVPPRAPCQHSIQRKKISTLLNICKNRSSSIGSISSPQATKGNDQTTTQESINYAEVCQNLKLMLVDKDKLIQSLNSKLVIYEKQLQDLNQQVVHLTLHKEQQQELLSEQQAELDRLKQLNFSNTNQEYRRLLESEKSFGKIRQQIPFLTAAMKQMQSIFDSLESIPHEKEHFDHHQMSLSSVSMVEMINDIKESTGPINPFKKNQLQSLNKCPLLPDEDQVLTPQARKESLTHLIQKHLSKREQPPKP